MSKSHIQRSYDAPKRKRLSWKQTWQASDRGLIICWESGRELALSKRILAEKAKANELPVLVWRGGVESTLKSGKKEGALHYLAQWQGLRGEALDIDWTKEYQLTCSRTKVTVTFNKQASKDKAKKTDKPPVDKSPPAKSAKQSQPAKSARSAKKRKSGQQQDLIQ